MVDTGGFAICPTRVTLRMQHRSSVFLKDWKEGT